MSLAIDEQWRPIPGFEGWYEASDHGRIRSADRVVVTSAGWSKRLRGKVLKQRPDKQGYLLVTLSRDGQPSTHFAHRLVALTFLGPCPVGMEVRHLDGDPAHVRPANLAYGTHRENMLDMREHGTNRNANKTHCPRGHEYTPKNTYRESGSGAGRRCKICRNAERAARRQAARVAC